MIILTCLLYEFVTSCELFFISKSIIHAFIMDLTSVKVKKKLLALLFLLYQSFISTYCISLLDKTKSYAIFNSWNITSVGKLELRFKTQCQYCLLLYVDNIDYRYDYPTNKKTDSSSDKKATTYLQISLVQGQLYVVQRILSEQYKKTLVFGEDLNDLRWHTLVITKFIEGTLQVQVDKITKVIQFSKNIISFFHINSRLYLGGLPELRHGNADVSAIIKPRFVGCIEDLKYSSGSLLVKPIRSVYKGESIALQCSDKCTKNPCQNGGKCINLFTKSKCECFGTGFEGSLCNKPSTAVTLQQNEYIKWKTRALRKDRIYLRLRMKAAFANGLLFYTKRNGRTFVIELVNGRLRVALGKPGQALEEKLVQRNLFDAYWHTISVRERSKNIEIIIDDAMPEYLTHQANSNNKDETSNIDSDDAIFIGGIEKAKFTYGVTSGRNFEGCLQHLEYNKDDVIYKIQKTINRNIVVVGGLKYKCSYNELNIILPTTTTQAPIKKSTRDDQHNKDDDGYDRNNDEIINKNIPIREIHTRDNTIGTGVIVWITAAIVIGTILIMGSAACVVHQVRRKYRRKTRKAKLALQLKKNVHSPDIERIQLKSTRKKKMKIPSDSEDSETKSGEQTPSIESPILARDVIRMKPPK